MLIAFGNEHLKRDTISRQVSGLAQLRDDLKFIVDKECNTYKSGEVTSCILCHPTVHQQLRKTHIKEIKKLAATKSRHLSTEEVETDFPSAKENGQTFLIDIQTFVLHCLTIASWSYYEEDLTSPCCNGKILPAELWQSMRQGKH